MGGTWVLLPGHSGRMRCQGMGGLHWISYLLSWTTPRDPRHRVGWIWPFPARSGSDPPEGFFQVNVKVSVSGMSWCCFLWLLVARGICCRRCWQGCLNCTCKSGLACVRNPPGPATCPPAKPEEDFGPHCCLQGQSEAGFGDCLVWKWVSDKKRSV